MARSSLDRHRTRLAVAASAIGAMACFAFIGVNRTRGAPLVALVDLGLGLALAANAVFAWRNRGSRAIAALPVGGMIVFLVIAGTHRALASYLWAYVMPPLVMAMVGPAWGLGLSALILLVMLAMLRVVPPTELDPASASLSVGASYLVTTLLAWLYERARLDHEAELDRLSTRDDLTGALNRRAFRRALAAALEQRRQHPAPLSVILIDADRFKRINDTWGHAAGDAVLQALADVARSVLGEGDQLGRLGGDEFAVLCRRPARGAPGSDAASLADRLREHAESLDFAFGGRVTVTLGVAAAEEGDTVDSLLARADRALYAAKRSGRNGVGVAGNSAAG